MIPRPRLVDPNMNPIHPPSLEIKQRKPSPQPNRKYKMCQIIGGIIIVVVTTVCILGFVFS